jgi:hypothetical protein
MYMILKWKYVSFNDFFILPYCYSNIVPSILVPDRTHFIQVV